MDHPPSWWTEQQPRRRDSYCWKNASWINYIGVYKCNIYVRTSDFMTNRETMLRRHWRLLLTEKMLRVSLSTLSGETSQLKRVWRRSSRKEKRIGLVDTHLSNKERCVQLEENASLIHYFHKWSIDITLHTQARVQRQTKILGEQM